METLQHVVGLCTDNHSHFDLLDLLIGGSFFSSALIYIKWRWKEIISWVRRKK
jgi:hypothetical protein